MKKKIKNKPLDLMEITRAAVCFVNDRSQDEKMWAFLSLFHPEMSDAQKRKLCTKE
jgi:hypothetical protein